MKFSIEIVDFCVLVVCSKPIFWSKVAQKGKICSRLLEPQKVAPNAKSCSKVAKHNRERPNRRMLNHPDHVMDNCFFEARYYTLIFKVKVKN